MISNTITEFLKQLTINNNKEWFHANKPMYQQAKKDFENYIEALIPEIAKIDPSMKEATPKDSIFRIFRDVRFSKNKEPYKNNFGAYMVKGGRKSGNAGYYLHIEPDNSFIGGGIYMPPAPILNPVRAYIDANPEKFRKILASKKFKEIYGEIMGEQLKSAPRGYSKDLPHLDLLKFKSYAAITKLSDKDLKRKDLDKTILESFQTLKPFNDFINEGIIKG